VQCFAGRILDIVVDIRVGSPTFGSWDAIELDDTTRNALYIAEGLGHAFCALTDSVTIGYLCSEPFAPSREHGIHPLDPDLALPWPSDGRLLSPKDAAAPTLAEALADGLLPQYEACQGYLAELRRRFTSPA
jgi:dTDP-4-dehydrorhamnose 3,5-epimerase